MIPFKAFIKEEKGHHEIPFEHNPKLGWHGDHEHVTLYHGTHIRNLHSVYKNGLTHKDPTSGMISLALEPHTAHGYAAMSSAGGEHHFVNKTHFRYAGGKAAHTPEKDRVVFKLRVPKHWLDKHKDPLHHGNLGHSRKRITDKSEYEKLSKEKDHEDHAYYAMSEFRVNQSVPKEFIVGHMRKKT